MHAELKMFRKTLLILFLICWSNYSAGFLDELFYVAKKAGKVVQFLNHVKATKDTATDFASFFSDSHDHEEVMTKLGTIESHLEHFTSFAKDKLNEIVSLLKALPEEIAITSKKSELGTFIAQTDDQWRTYTSAMKENYNIDSLKDLTRVVLDSIGAGISVFRQTLIPSLLINTLEEGFFMLVAKHALDARDSLCGGIDTFHTFLTHVFQIVIQTEIKAHILLSFAYKLRWSEKDASKKITSMIEPFRQQFIKYIHGFSQALNNGRLPYLRACDPEGLWTRDVTFLELEGFLQETVYRLNEGCYNQRLTCPDMPVAEEWIRGCFMHRLTAHSACNGRPYNCQDMSHPLTDTTVCLWNGGIHRIRFVTWKGQTYRTDSNVENCPLQDRYSHKAFQWVHSTRPFCKCQCQSSQWKLVARLIRSRVTDNYVVVGVRLKKILNFIYIQIAEGKLESDGHISDSSWVSITRKTTAEHPEDGMRSVDLFRRAFFFDDVQLPPGYILTGIQFVRIYRNQIEGFSIGISGVPFDYGSGKLNSRDESFILASSPENERELIYKRRNSFWIHPALKNHPDSAGFTYLTLQQSEMDDDFGQSTLPLFDSVPIGTEPFSPIGGVGLFHKAHDYGKAAGLLSLRLFPIDYLGFIDTFLKEHNLTAVSTWLF